MKSNENSYVAHFLSPEEVSKVFGTACDTVRNSCRCPNGRMCKDRFQGEDNNSIIFHERQKIWKLDSKVVDLCFFADCI